MNYVLIFKKEMRRLGAPTLSVLVFVGRFWILGSKINASKLGRCTSLGCGRALAQDPLLQNYSLVFIIPKQVQIIPSCIKYTYIIAYVLMSSEIMLLTKEESLSNGKEKKNVK